MDRAHLDIRMQEVCTELLLLQDREDCERRLARSEHASHLAQLRRARSMHANHAARSLRAQDGRHQRRGRVSVPPLLPEKHNLQARELVPLVLSDSEYATSSTVTVSLPERHRHTGRRPLPTNTDATKDNGSFTSVPEQVWPTTSFSTSQETPPRDAPPASTPNTASVTKNTQATISKTSASAGLTTKSSKKESHVITSAASSSRSKTTKTAKDEIKTTASGSTAKPATRTRSSSTYASSTKSASPSPTRPVRIVTVCGAEGAQAKDAGGQQRRYNWTTRTVYDASCTLEASAPPSSSFSPHATSSANSPIANFPNEPMDVPEADTRDDPQAFFATPRGKGAIAGITAGSVALTLLVLAILFWRRPRKRDSDIWGLEKRRRRSAMSTSSFGDDSGDTGSFVDAGGLHASSSTFTPHSQPMGEARTSLRDEPSFVVESRRRSAAWNAMDPSQLPSASTVGAGTAAAGLRPLRQGDQSTGFDRPNAADDGGDPSPLDRIPYSSSHDHEHNPFDDPAVPEVAQLSAQASAPLTAYAPTRARDGVERRKSAGFTSDTYRSSRRKSRPLSVRNPDVDPAPAGPYAEPNFAHHPSEQDEQEALTPTLLEQQRFQKDTAGVSTSKATGQSKNDQAQPKLVNPVTYRQSLAPSPSPDLSLRSPLTNLADGLEAEATNLDQKGSWKSWKNPLSYSSSHTNPLLGYFPDVRTGSLTGDQSALPPVSNLTPMRPPMNSAISAISHLRSSRPGTAVVSAQQHHHEPPKPDTRQSRTSSSSNSTSRSSFSMYPFGGYHRSWANDGVETPVEIQDVQLGGSTVGTGNGLTGSFLGNTSAMAGIGYFR